MLISQGTASVSNGGTIVTGVGTSWATSGIIPGMSIFSSPAASGHQARVARVVNATQLRLADPWTGISLSGAIYSIAVDFTPSLNLPLIDQTAVEMVRLWNTIMARIEARFVALNAPLASALPRISENSANIPDLWNAAIAAIEARLGLVGPPPPPPPGGAVVYGTQAAAYGGQAVEY